MSTERSTNLVITHGNAAHEPDPVASEYLHRAELDGNHDPYRNQHDDNHA